MTQEASRPASLSSAAIRARAARLVSQVADEGRSLDGLFAQLQGSDQERGLTRSLVYGTIRWHVRLTAVLSQLSSRPVKELDRHLRALLLLGLYQLLQTDIAPHAAVAETVEATRALKQPKTAGLANAILRRCQREQVAIVAQVDQDLAVRTSHPRWLVEALQRDWPDRCEEILQANNRHPPMWLRVNAQRATAGEFLGKLQAVGHDGALSDCAPQAVCLGDPVDVRNLPGFAVGDVSVQDAAAQWAALLLAAENGDRVLDACAAPGGKTSHILELQPNLNLTALDISKERMRRVQENLERLHLQASLLVGDVSSPQEWWDRQRFRRILLDVPCSATGVIRRHPDIKLLRRPGDIAGLAATQARMLRTVWPLLEPGGRLVYASCSALRVENAAVVAAFLDEHPDAQDTTPEQLARSFPCLNLPPHLGPGYAIPVGYAQMDGFYYACLDKTA